MFPDPLDDASEVEPLDPSRVVPYLNWTDSSIDNDMRIIPPPAPGQDTTHSLWAAGLMTEPQPDGGASGEGEQGHWLAGLVREEAAPEERPRRSWTSALAAEEVPLQDQPTQATSWLAGLVMEEKKRPALNDIARLLLGDSGVRPKPPLLPPPVRSARRPGSEERRNTGSSLPNSASHEGPRTPAPPEPSRSVESSTGTPEAVRASDSTESTKTREMRITSDLAKSTKTREMRIPSDRAESTKTREMRIPSDLAKSTKTREMRIPPSLGESTRTREMKLPPPQDVRMGPLGPRGRIASRDKVSFYRSLSTMFQAGVPLFAIFEFLSREEAGTKLGLACRRIGQNLVSGLSLPAAASQEPHLFDLKAVRLLEAGYRGGQLAEILVQLADDEEHAWKLRQGLISQLVYPCGIALLTLVAVMLLPPLVLTDLLSQVISLTSQPPFLTVMLLKFSAFLSSPWTMAGLLAVTLGFGLWLRGARGQALLQNLELSVWFIPAVGPLWRNVVALRFLRVFAMTYRAGLIATTGMELAASASGSQLAYRVVPLMKKTLLDGGSLSESFAAGGFLPGLALEAIQAGEMAGKVPVMLENTSVILASEVESRIDAVVKLVEPLVLACLGAIVGIFVLGCLLPIVELTATL